MTYEELVATTRGTIARDMPEVTRFFDELCDYIASRAGKVSEHVQAAARLAVVSRYQYVDYAAHVDSALLRSELDLFSATALELSRIEFHFGKSFLAAYGTMRVALRDVASSILALAYALKPIGKPGRRAFSKAFVIVSKQRPGLVAQVLTHVAAKCPGILDEAATIIEREARIQNAATLTRWLDQAASLFGSERVEAARSTILLTSPESRNLLGLKYVVLSDVRRMLSIYCTSIAERGLGVVDCDASSFGIGRPYTDGARMFLPGKIDLFSDREANRRAYISLGALQAALFPRGSFGLSFDALPWLNELRDRYGALIPDVMDTVRREYRRRARLVRDLPTGEVEAMFAGERTIRLLETPHEQFFYLFPTPAFVRELFVLAERTRLKRHLQMRYPGLHVDLAEVDAALEARLERDVPRLLTGDYGPEATMAAAGTGGPGGGGDRGSVRGAGKATWGEAKRVGAPPWKNTAATGVMSSSFRGAVLSLVRTGLRDRGGHVDLQADEFGRRVTVMFANRVRADGTVADSARIAFDLYNEFFDAFPLVAYAMNEDTRLLFEPYLEFSYNPEVVRDVEPNLFAVAKPVFERRAEPPRDEVAVDLSSLGKRDGGKRAAKEALLSGSLSVLRYQEYDISSSGYRQAHTTLFETRLPRGNPEELRRAVAQRGTLKTRITKRFQSMVPEEVEVSRKWLDGDEIDLGDATDYAIDLLRGASADEKVYRRKSLNRRDIATYVVIDASSSTAERVAGERIIDIEKVSVALLAGALDAVGDDFAVASFFSMNRNNVFFQVAKTFVEKWGPDGQGRLSQVEANAGNRDGCAIRHATRRLAELPHKTKLLLFLSDGIPADVGYGGTSAADTSTYAIEDTRRSLLEARRNGITPYCITVDALGHDYLPYLYGQRHFRVIRDVEMLPEALARLYARITT